MDFLSDLANYILMNAVQRSPAYGKVAGLSQAIQYFLGDGV